MNLIFSGSSYFGHLENIVFCCGHILLLELRWNRKLIAFMVYLGDDIWEGGS